ncbi:MAG: sporulation protein YunB, partial [Clostridia bacterium]|nr:sporulation protein YunB [Clostridia bacterium]
ERYTLSIPIGTIIGNEYTLGRGPEIKFKMQITTTVIADFESKFYSAGINQVLHQIHIKVKANGHTVIPWYRSAFNVNTSVIAAETVIVGLTPEAYTNVIESGTDATEDIFDFGTH